MSEIDYEPCSCHRPSWGYVKWAIESARRDERAAIEWEEFVAYVATKELSARRLQENLSMLKPRPKGERRFLQVSP
jgi:hypothetical protein